MTDRQVLVMDNSNDLIEMIRDALVIYGFDAHLVAAGEDGIHSVKSLRPEAVFVGAEQSDKSRLALCSKAKKVAGSQIPVILVSSSIPQTDLDLHGKQRYHADAYLSKWDLASGEFLEKISSLIKLKPDEQADAQPTSDARPADAAHQGSVDLQDGASEDSLEIPSSGQTPEDLPDNLDADPGWLSELYTKIVSDDSGDDGKNTPPVANDTQHALPEDTYPEDDLEQRLQEQEKEIAFLQAQLDEARREARSSPFSSDYLNLREDAVQKERELVRLADRLEKYRRRALSGEERLKDLAKRLFNTKADLEQSQSQQKEIALRNETIQNELTRLYGAFDESRKHHDTRIEEIKSEHATGVEKMEQAHQATVDSLQSQINQKKTDARAEAESALKDEIEQQKREHDDLKSRLTKQQREHDERISQKKKEHLDEIAEVKRSNEKERQELEARIEALRAEHQDEITEIKASKQEERQDLEARIEAMRAGHQDEITKIKSSKQEERQELVAKIEALRSKHQDEVAETEALKKKERQELEVKFEDLRTKHQAALKGLEEEHQTALSALENRIEKEKAKASTLTDNEWQKKIARNQHEYDEIIAELKKAHADEMAKIQSSFDSGQQQLDNEIAALLTDHESAIEEQQKKHQAVVAEMKKQIAKQKAVSGKAERDDIVNKLTKEHAGEIARLDEKLKETQKKFKSRLNEIKAKQLHEFKNKEKKYTAQIKALKKRLEEQKSQEKEEDKSDSQHDEPVNKTEKEYANENASLKKQLEELEEKHKQELHENDLQHAADIAKIREELGNETDNPQSKEDKIVGNDTDLARMVKEKEAEIEELKKEAERAAKRAAQMFEEEKEAHEETRIRLESTIAEKLVAKSKRG
jgi:CheY-like chemotaxis protein